MVFAKLRSTSQARGEVSTLMKAVPEGSSKPLPDPDLTKPSGRRSSRSTCWSFTKLGCNPAGADLSEFPSETGLNCWLSVSDGCFWAQPTARRSMQQRMMERVTSCGPPGYPNSSRCTTILADAPRQLARPLRRLGVAANLCRLQAISFRIAASACQLPKCDPEP